MTQLHAHTRETKATAIEGYHPTMMVWKNRLM